MQEYERSISLRTIYLTLLRRIEWIILIFVPIVLASFIVTNFVMVKRYKSSVNLTNTAAISAAQYQVMQTYVLNDDTIDEVVLNLKTKSPMVKHSNGEWVSAKEIKSGVTFSTLASNSISITFSFETTDSTIAKPVLQELADVAAAKLVEAKYMPNITAGTASGPSKSSSENKYFLIAVAGGFVLACALPFIYEIAADQVYDKKDIALFGAEGFELKASK